MSKTRGQLIIQIGNIDLSEKWYSEEEWNAREQKVNEVINSIADMSEKMRNHILKELGIE